MWDVVLDGPHVLMKTKAGSEALEQKLRSEWTELEIKKVQVNFKAINTLHCALNSTEFNHIFTCKTAKEIWDKLKVTHEGTSHVKKSKTEYLCWCLYESFQGLLLCFGFWVF